MAKSWFVYISGDPALATSFIETVGMPTCNTPGTLCAIYASILTGNLPAITALVYAAEKRAFNGGDAEDFLTRVKAK